MFPGINLKIAILCSHNQFPELLPMQQLIEFSGKIYPTKYMAGSFKATPDFSSRETPNYLDQVASKKKTAEQL